MTITDRVQGAFFDSDSDENTNKLIRLAPNAPPSKGPTRRQGRPWTHDEHDKFLHAMEMYPSGPWKSIAAFVGTRTTRQTMTHAQKYRQKIARWKRGAQAKVVSPPPSPQVGEEEVNALADDMLEDTQFWQLLEEIVQVNDDQTFLASVGSPLDMYQQPVAVSSGDGYTSHAMDYTFGDLSDFL